MRVSLVRVLGPPDSPAFRAQGGNATFGVAGCLPPGPLVVSRVTPATSPRLAAGDFGDRGDSRAEGVCSLSLFPLFPPHLPLSLSQWVWELCEFFLLERATVCLFDVCV